MAQALPAAALGIGVLWQSPVACRADGLVTNCSEAALRAALSGGGQVTLACDGVIVLADALVITNDTTLEATGHAVTVSGGNNTRVVVINPGASLVLRNITIADGTARGTNSTVGNGVGGPGLGGAVLNDRGTLEASNCVFRGNRALGGTGGPGVSGTIAFNRGGDGLGGAIFNDSGTMRLVDLLFDGNVSQGGRGGTAPPVSPSRGGSGGLSAGGAIYSRTGLVTIARCRFVSNSAPASLPGPANGFNPSSGPAMGGGIYSVLGALQITGSRFEHQFCGGGEAFCTASGGALMQGGGVLRVTGCSFVTNRVVGGNGIIIGVGGNSGNASGGAVLTAHVSPPNQDEPPILCVAGITNSIFVGNEVRGGIQAPAFSPAGYGYGGALYNNGHLNMLNCTLTANVAAGGAVVEPGYPVSSAYGGAIYTWHTRATSALTHVTMAQNQARVGNGAGSGSVAQGGGIFVLSGQVRLRNSILAGNLPGANGFGPLLDEGNNISSDASCAFTLPGSLNSTDPMLLPLDDYGGPTLTMALRPGSPAIDAGSASFCAPTDQRGVLRPQNRGCDIGAFEATFVAIRRGLEGPWLIEHVGVPFGRCTLQTSADLLDWHDVDTAVADDTGHVRFTRPNAAGAGNFFRTVFP